MKQNLTVTFRRISGKKELQAGILRIIEELNIKSVGWLEGTDFDINNPK